jgi:S-DNA-T family DNA segregation ATPase FtsK/SpoIIIE
LNKGCPPLDLLDAKREEYVEQHGSELEDELMRALFEYGLDFVSLKNIDEGPMVTRFTFDLEAGRKISEITKYQQELAMFLGVENLNMQPSRDGLVVEMPNRVRRKVSILETLSKCGAGKKPLALPLGLTVSGELLSVDLEKAPHLLIAGATGSGKSVCLNSILTGILLSSTPDETRLILIDPKRVELYSYEGIPHLLMPVVYEHEKVAKVLDWCVYEMEKRYELFAKAQARDINLYNAKASERLPRIVIVLDELADLMLTVKDEIEQGVLKLGQKARAAGIHMIVATQRPSTDIVTGTIKANLPTRIAFATSTQADSRVILDENGAEKLLGEGDGLLMTTQTRTLVRFQGAYVSEAEIERISEWWRKKGAKSAYRAEIDWEPDEAESVQEEEASNKCGSGCNADMKLAQKRCESADVVKDSHYEVLKRFIAELEPEETESETYLPPLREIAERLGMSTKRVFETVKLLESEGMIEKVGEGSRMARYRRRAG